MNKIDQIKPYLKEKVYYICPNCGKPVMDFANPMCKVDCKNCGWIGGFHGLEYKTTIEIVEQILNVKNVK